MKISSFVRLSGGTLTFLLFGASLLHAQIQVTSARIGCLDVQKQPNLTTIVANACNGKYSCSYKAPTPQQYQAEGVTAATRFACTQAMEILYACGHGASQTALVPGDAWSHPPADLECAPPAASTGSGGTQNPEVAVLRGVLDKYKSCILERYETKQDMVNRGLGSGASGLSSASGLQTRDMVQCVAGNMCSLASREALYATLLAQANRGDPNGFETSLEKAIPNDCFQCQKHAEEHTKHVHCTMECGGNNGITQGPCFEGCKAGVDLTKLANDVVADLNGALQSVGIGKPQETQASGGASVATNYSIVTSTEAESCNANPDGFFIAPPNLLDWTPTDAPPFKQVLTGYAPPAPPTQSQYRPLAVTVQQRGPLNIGANEGRLRADLRKAAQRAVPAESLCSAAKAFAAGNTSDGNAFADLSVTGRRSFAAFHAHPPQLADLVACLRSDARAKTLPDATLQRSAGMALDRAYRVIHAVRVGAWPGTRDNAACTSQRGALGYIAVSGEDDQPHRPVNVPSAEFPQYDLAVPVRRPSGQPLLVHTRFMIAHTTPPAGAGLDRCDYTGASLPAQRAPVLAPNAEVILFIHGMDSRLEEAMDLTHALHALGRQYGRNYTIVSMDLPTSGYADNLDYNLIAPLSVDGHATGGVADLQLGFAPNGHEVPVVNFIEDFIVSFVNTLDGQLHGQLAPRIKAVIGGSLGGNMSMRLGRPRSDAAWIKNVVPWSPAAIWPSMADDQAQHAALAVPWYFAGGDPSYAVETPGSRRSFFYGGFDWQSKAAGIIPLGGGKPQAEYWYDDTWRCKVAHMHLGRVDRYETYDHNFRLWHWRLGMEQLIFSQQIQQGGHPLYLANTTRMLLLCGMDDVGGNLCQHTREVAPKMIYTPGYARFVSATGHSIHNERPNFLGKQIVSFIDGPPKP